MFYRFCFSQLHSARYRKWIKYTFKRNTQNLSHFEEFFFKNPFLDNEFLQITRTKEDSKKNINVLFDL
jgi:hypothetical protein